MDRVINLLVWGVVPRYVLGNGSVVVYCAAPYFVEYFVLYCVPIVILLEFIHSSLAGSFKAQKSMLGAQYGT